MLSMNCVMVADKCGAPADVTDSTEHVFEVQPGSTALGLGPRLETAGLIEDADSFTMYVRLSKEGGCIKAGQFRLRRDMSAKEILDTLCGVPLADDVPFTVVEGWRIREIDAALVQRGWATPGQYTAMANDPEHFEAQFDLPSESLEGYLYPETYMVDVDRFSVEGFIQRQLDTFSSRFYEPNIESISTNEHGLADIVIMASMIEREEPTPHNRSLVVGILWKRLANQWNLGVDATSRYTLVEWNDRRAFLAKLRDPDDPYNTRLRGGLPPTAIGNPGVSSLQATLEPEDSPYWYYLHDSDQVLHPSRTVSEHEAYRRRYNVY